MQERYSTLIPRQTYIKAIRPFIDLDVIKVLVGLRRSGKSELLRLIQQELERLGRSSEQFIYINFEDFTWRDLKNAERLYQYIMPRIQEIETKFNRAYVFLDEVQEVAEFEYVINSLRATTNTDVYITGSNSTLLSGELATKIAGRYVQFEVFPLSLSEYNFANQYQHRQFQQSYQQQSYQQRSQHRNSQSRSQTPAVDHFTARETGEMPDSNIGGTAGKANDWVIGKAINDGIQSGDAVEVMQSVQPATIEVFNSYLRQGGMPFIAVHAMDEVSARTYLRDIYNSVILKDIVQRYNIRDVSLFEKIVLFAMQNIGNLITASTIAKYLKSQHIDVGTQTIINYLEYCCESYLLHKCEKYDVQGKRILKIQQKYYVGDLGIRAAVINDGMQQIQGLLENLVAFEALRRGYQVYVGASGNAEIDFVITRGEQKRYIQVAYMLSSEQAESREFGAFSGIADNYPKTVVSLDALLRPRDGIEHRNLVEFLQAADW